ncbi:MAG: efflux RND transporter permease subunit [Myxococcota bacterium]
MKERKGAITWFVDNPVAANLLMLMLLLGGVLMGLRVRQEVFPDFKLDVITVRVAYPGASPTEVEQGIVLAVEESVRGVDGVDRITSSAQEGGATIFVHLELDAEGTVVLSDVKNEVDRLTSLPEDSERPQVSLLVNRFEVIDVLIHGNEDPALLRSLAENVKEEFLNDPGITNAEIAGAPPHEWSIEVSSGKLREFGLTLDQVSAAIQVTALELPGGSVKAAGGEVLVRTSERRHRAADLADIPVITSPTGTEVTLGQIATIRETFAETDQSALYNGRPSVMVKVFRSGDQTPIEVADRVKGHVERLGASLPEGVEMGVWVDWSQIYRERIDLLVRNARIGLILVLLVLGMFLELRLAFWVTLGIPVSFLGALLLMPTLGVSINMISLFAFIITLGMVVDDAIVVGENIHEMRQRGVPRLKAAIDGAKGVAVPVTFSITTSVVAFMPMLFVPGAMGKLFAVIPAIVISVLIISLVESMWVLPAHLKALKEPSTKGIYGWVHGQQQRISSALTRFIETIYAPVLRSALRRRYVSLAIGIAILLSTVGWVASGQIGFRFMPEIDGDVALAEVELPFGTPVAETERYLHLLQGAAEKIIEDNGEDGIVKGIYAQVGTPMPTDPGRAMSSVIGGHIANVTVFFVSSGEREISANEFLRRWRQEIGNLAGVERLKFSIALGPSPGPALSVELKHDDMEVLEMASADVAGALRKYPGVWDVDDGYQPGKAQLDLKLTKKASVLGLTSGDIARQVRAAFYGTEAFRQQEGRNEVRVVVRLPRGEREFIHDFESLLVRTKTGGEVPLREVAEIVPGRSYPVIARSEGQRMVEVTGDVRSGEGNPNQILESVAADDLPGVLEKYPGLSYEFGGSLREQKKTMTALASGGAMAILAIYALLAIPFRSYAQPVIVMLAIPFGFVGAVIGHELMGFELSMISSMGLIALAGVVVNDSLVLIDAANKYRAEGKSLFDAIHAAGVRRFRPILLTSLTTFLGLAPMITETSAQAQFLIQMALSLG